MQLCYTPLSPFCRKVRLALDFKHLACDLLQVDRLADLAAPSRRAEVPVLVDGSVVVANSPDILAYLDRLQPEPPLYPRAAAAYADVRHWELLADTRLDAIVSVVGTFRLSPDRALPEAVMRQAECEVDAIYTEMDEQLATHEYLCGAPSAADFAAFPHVVSGAALGLRCDAQRQPHLLRWLRTMRGRPEGMADAAAVRDWWAHRETRPVDVTRINWGPFRLEWLLAHGMADWFAAQVASDQVLWSVGPQRQRVQVAAAPSGAVPPGAVPLPARRSRKTNRPRSS